MMLSFHEEEEGLPESFLSNFPSLIKVDIHAKVTDPSVAKSMMGCLLSSLKANGRWWSLLRSVLHSWSHSLSEGSFLLSSFSSGVAFVAILFCLSPPGSLGAFCKVRQTDKRMMDFYSKLGCFEVAKMEGFPKDVIIMGRSL